MTKETEWQKSGWTRNFLRACNLVHYGVSTSDIRDTFRGEDMSDMEIFLMMIAVKIHLQKEG